MSLPKNRCVCSNIKSPRVLHISALEVLSDQFNSIIVLAGCMARVQDRFGNGNLLFSYEFGLLNVVLDERVLVLHFVHLAQHLRRYLFPDLIL